jgi:hypothetical protein
MSVFCIAVVIFGFCASAASAQCSSNRTCLDIKLVDLSGDGWNGEKFFVETPWGEIFSDAPSCGRSEVTHTNCTDASGNYPMVLIHENESYTPENYWEDLFTVSTSKCNHTMSTYTGGYNTTMIFNYEAEIDEWSIVYFENLWENEKNCNACGDARACRPKRKGKKKRAKSKSSNKPKTSADDDRKSNSFDDDNGKLYSSDDDSNKKNSTGGKVKPRYGPPAVNVRVTMFDDGNDGWWQQDYRGASWYLADDRRTSLFQTGSLCGSDGKSSGKSGYCSLCLGDGSYSMRFSGKPRNEFTAWDFCGIQGGFAQELTFHVKKGKCIADSLLSLDADCYGTVVSTVTVRGVINLMGLTSEFIESSQYSILPAILADSVVGWEAKNIEVQSTTLTSRALSSPSRSLAEFDVDVQFGATFESEADFGVEGRLYSNVVNLVSFLEESLATRVSSDGFSVSLAQSALLAGAVSLENVQNAELVSLELESITYEGVQTMRASTLPSFDESEYWGSSAVLNVSLYNAESIAVFAVVVVAGFFAFVGLMSHGMNGYRRVSQMGDSMHEVTPLEMDSSISVAAVASSKGNLRTEMKSSL